MVTGLGGISIAGFILDVIKARRQARGPRLGRGGCFSRRLFRRKQAILTIGQALPFCADHR